MGGCTHRLCDSLAEHGQQEEGGDGRGQVAGDRLDVVEELATVGTLDDGDPEDADDHQEDHKHSVWRAEGAVRGPGRVAWLRVSVQNQKVEGGNAWLLYQRMLGGKCQVIEFQKLGFWFDAIQDM